MRAHKIMTGCDNSQKQRCLTTVAITVVNSPRLHSDVLVPSTLGVCCLVFTLRSFIEHLVGNPQLSSVGVSCSS